MMDEDDFQKFIATTSGAETEVKTMLVKLAEEMDGSNNERIAFMQTVSLAIAAAAIGAAVAAVERGEADLGKLTMDLANKTVLTELAALAVVLHEAGHDTEGFQVIKAPGKTELN